MAWPSVSLDTPVGELADSHIAASGIGVQNTATVALMSIGRRRGDQVKVTCMDVGLRSSPPPMAATQLVPASAAVAEVLLGLGQIRATAASRVPGISWPSSAKPVPSWVIVIMSVAAALVALLGVLLGNELVLGFAPGLVASTVIAAITLRGNSLAAIPAHVREGGREIMLSKVRSRIPLAPPAGPSPAQRVDQVKASYGELMSDIIYRIENSALFDPSVPATQQFQLALLAWDPNSPEAAQLATDVERSFQDARAEAERLGLNHLPTTAQPTARRAAKAAAVALNSGSAAEREAAGEQVAHLLESLALYWMPSIDAQAPSLIGVRKMIEPTP